MKSKFSRIFPKMTPKEQDMYLTYCFAGQWIMSENMILMGSDAIERLENFQQEMVDKYFTEELSNPIEIEKPKDVKRKNYKRTSKNHYS
jgi:sugar (pentulose or hexulose) kinase